MSPISVPEPQLNTLDGDLALDTVAAQRPTLDAALEEAGITTVGLHAVGDGTFEVPTRTVACRHEYAARTH
ncbi:MAG: hypothetical protein R3B96_09170 [Pirellulaceae bacterium]